MSARAKSIGQPISLWDIVRAFILHELVSALRQIERAVCPIGDREASADAERVKLVYKAVREIVPPLTALRLPVSVRIATDFLCMISNARMHGTPITERDVSAGCSEIMKVLESETHNVVCLKVEETSETLIGGSEALPQFVHDRFPGSVIEIREAADCLVHERGTACVFHLMRSVELVVKAAWKTLGLAAPKLADSWGNLLRPMDEQLKAPPQSPNQIWQSNLAFFSDLVNDLRAVKRSCRDRTMHVESTYTTLEARGLLNGTVTLIRHVAARLDQDGNLQPPP